MTLVQFAKEREGKEIVLLGFDEAAAWSAAAAAQSGGIVTKLAVAPGDFRFAKITDIRDPNLLPGAVKYGDLAGLLALNAPTPLGVFGDQWELRLTHTAYNAAGVSLKTVESEDPAMAAVEWVIGE